MMKHPGLETPGGLIREKRETEGISLPEMSERTKIPPQVLAAIERDEYHKVSGALYIKSFLRTCAVELGLDADELLDLYGSFSGEHKPRARGGDPVWSEDEVEISHIGLPWRNIGIIGAVLVIGGVGALLSGRGCDNQGEKPTAVVAQSGETVPAVTTEDVSTQVRETLTVATDSITAMPSDPVALDRPDTLAGAWASGEDVAPVAATPTFEKEEPKRTVVVTEPDAVTSDTAPIAAKPTVVSETQAALPFPLVGGPHLLFAGGQKKKVVLRVICDRRTGIQVKRDAEQAFGEAKWPSDGISAPPLPSTGIKPGRVYGVSRGFVVYWGANDHLSLRLDRTDGVEVALNGKVRNVRNLRPGGELLLDDHGN